MAVEIRTFEGGLDRDVDERLIEPNKYRYALNVRNGDSEQGSFGAISNIEGNQLVSFSLPAGYNRVIGAVDDEPNDRVIYLVYNSNGTNRILQYDYKLNSIDVIYADSGNVLGFKATHNITAINIVTGGEDTYLLYSLGEGEPYNINIDAGLRTFGNNKIYKGLYVSGTYYENEVVYYNVSFTAKNGSTVQTRFYYRAKAATNTAPATITSPQPTTDWELCPSGYVYTTVDEEFVTNAVKPPLDLPSTEFSTDQSFKVNKLRGNFWQFKYKYVSADGRESSWSPISTINPSGDIADSYLTPTTVIDNEFARNNVLNVYVDVPNFVHYKYIKVAVRNANNDLAPNDWKLLKSVPVKEIENFVYTSKLQFRVRFTGNELLMPLDQSEANQLFSWIPLDVKAQTVTSRNRIIYANFTEGRDFYLDGENDILNSPPSVTMFERNNPYSVAGATTTIAGTVVSGGSTSAATSNEQLATPLYNDLATDGNYLRVRFQNIEVGAEVRLDVSIETSSTTSTQEQLSYGYEAVVYPTSTAETDLIDAFVDKFNNNENFYASRYAGNMINTYFLSAESANVGGVDYLHLIPIGTSDVDVYVTRFPKFEVGSLLIPIQTYKRGSEQRFSIIYQDERGRLSTAIEHPNFTVSSPWWRDASYSGASGAIAGNDYGQIGQRYVQIQLNHQAPSWAVRYFIGKTRTNGLARYVSLPLSRQKALPTINGATNPLNDKYFFRGFVNKNISANTAITSSDSIAGEEFIYIPLSSLVGDYASSYNSITSSNIGYEYAKGDRLRFAYGLTDSGITKPTSTASYFESIDVEVVDYISDINCISVRVNDLPSNLTQTASAYTNFNGIFTKGNEDASVNNNVVGLLLELYTPDRDRDLDFYYEVYQGTVYEDNGVYYHAANNRNQTSAQSAIIELSNGDAWLKPRTYVVDFDATNSATIANSANSKMLTYYIEDENYYDKIESKTFGAGRPNRPSRTTSNAEDYAGSIGAIKRPNTMRYSQPFLPEQNFNGLGTIFDTSFKDTNSSLRSIQLLHTNGDRTFVYHENAVGFAMTDRQIVQTLDGNNLTIDADTPISDVQYYGNRAGISKNAESHAYNDFRQYFVDIDQGVVNRLSMDGVTPISEKGMNSYFKNIFRQMNTSKVAPTIIGAYDRRYDDYIINMKWSVEEYHDDDDQETTFNLPSRQITLDYGSRFNDYDIFVGDFTLIKSDNYTSGGTIYNSIEKYCEVVSISGTEVTYQLSTGLIDAINGNPVRIYYIYPTKSETVSYNERLKAWTSVLSYKPERISSAGVDLVSFRAGECYIHNDYANPARFYGVDYDTYIDVVSNKDPNNVKQWKTFWLNSNATYGEEVNFEVPSLPTLATTEPMTSGVVTGQDKNTTCQGFSYKEQKLAAEYMRTGSGYIEGDKVRGYWQKTRIRINAGVSKIYKIATATFTYIYSSATK